MAAPAQPPPPGIDQSRQEFLDTNTTWMTGNIIGLVTNESKTVSDSIQEINANSSNFVNTSNDISAVWTQTFNDYIRHYNKIIGNIDSNDVPLFKGGVSGLMSLLNNYGIRFSEYLNDLQTKGTTLNTLFTQPQVIGVIHQALQAQLPTSQFVTNFNSATQAYQAGNTAITSLRPVAPAPAPAPQLPNYNLRSFTTLQTNIQTFITSSKAIHKELSDLIAKERKHRGALDKAEQDRATAQASILATNVALQQYNAVGAVAAVAAAVAPGGAIPTAQLATLAAAQVAAAQAIQAAAQQGGQTPAQVLQLAQAGNSAAQTAGRSATAAATAQALSAAEVALYTAFTNAVRGVINGQGGAIPNYPPGGPVAAPNPQEQQQIEQGEDTTLTTLNTTIQDLEGALSNIDKYQQIYDGLYNIKTHATSQAQAQAQPITRDSIPDKLRRLMYGLILMNFFSGVINPNENIDKAVTAISRQIDFILLESNYTIVSAQPDPTWKQTVQSPNRSAKLEGYKNALGYFFSVLKKNNAKKDKNLELIDAIHEVIDITLSIIGKIKLDVKSTKTMKGEREDLEEQYLEAFDKINTLSLKAKRGPSGSGSPSTGTAGAPSGSGGPSTGGPSGSSAPSTGGPGGPGTGSQALWYQELMKALKTTTDAQLSEKLLSSLQELKKCCAGSQTSGAPALGYRRGKLPQAGTGGTGAGGTGTGAGGTGGTGTGAGSPAAPPPAGAQQQIPGGTQPLEVAAALETAAALEQPLEAAQPRRQEGGRGTKGVKGRKYRNNKTQKHYKQYGGDGEEGESAESINNANSGEEEDTAELLKGIEELLGVIKEDIKALPENTVEPENVKMQEGNSTLQAMKENNQEVSLNTGAEFENAKMQEGNSTLQAMKENNQVVSLKGSPFNTEAEFENVKMPEGNSTLTANRFAKEKEEGQAVRNARALRSEENVGLAGSPFNTEAEFENEQQSARKLNQPQTTEEQSSFGGEDLGDILTQVKGNAAATNIARLASSAPLNVGTRGDEVLIQQTGAEANLQKRRETGEATLEARREAFELQKASEQPKTGQVSAGEQFARASRRGRSFSNILKKPTRKTTPIVKTPVELLNEEVKGIDLTGDDDWISYRDQAITTILEDYSSPEIQEEKLRMLKDVLEKVQAKNTQTAFNLANKMFTNYPKTSSEPAPEQIATASEPASVILPGSSGRRIAEEEPDTITTEGGRRSKSKKSWKNKTSKIRKSRGTSRKPTTRRRRRTARLSRKV